MNTPNNGGSTWIYPRYQATLWIYIYITLYNNIWRDVYQNSPVTGMSHWSAACRVVAQLFLSQVPVSSHISELSTWRRKHEFLIVAAWRFGMIWPYFWLRYKMSQYVASSVLVLLCLISMHHLSQTHFGHRFSYDQQFPGQDLASIGWRLGDTIVTCERNLERLKGGRCLYCHEFGNGTWIDKKK